VEKLDYLKDMIIILSLDFQKTFLENFVIKVVTINFKPHNYVLAKHWKPLENIWAYSGFGSLQLEVEKFSLSKYCSL